MASETEGEEASRVEELIAAIRGADRQAACELLPRLPEPNALSADGESPLVACASVGLEQILAKLLAAGANPDAQCATGLSALAAASLNGHTRCVQQLLSASATVDLVCGRQKATALMYAAHNGNRSLCEMLLDAGADPQLKDAYGISAEQAAERFEGESRLQAWNFNLWARCVKARAQSIEEEPPSPEPPFPVNLAKDVERWYRDPTKTVWRPGEWLYQKRPASDSVLKQQRPLPFSSTGYGIETPSVPVERSSLPAEEFAKQVKWGTEQCNASYKFNVLLISLQLFE